MTPPRLGTLLRLPATAAHWWRRTTTAPRVEQWLLCGGVPLLLIAVWLTGVSSRLAFRLATDSLFASAWTLFTALTTNYLHVDGRHLFDNLLNFWVTLFAIYPLVAIADWNQQFRRLAVSYLLFVPFVIAWVNLTMLGGQTNQPSLGFSGIVAAFLGLVLVLLAVAADKETGGTLDSTWALVPFFGSLAAVFAVPSATYFPLRPQLAVGFAGLTVAAAALRYWLDRPLSLTQHAATTEPDHRLALLIGTTVFGAGVAGALLFVPAGTNVWGHLTGYTTGFVLALAVLLIERL